MGLWDPSGAYLLGWSRGREKAAGSSAELKVLVTHSGGRGRQAHENNSGKGAQAC